MEMKVTEGGQQEVTGRRSRRWGGRVGEEIGRDRTGASLHAAAQSDSSGSASCTNSIVSSPSRVSQRKSALCATTSSHSGRLRGLVAQLPRATPRSLSGGRGCVCTGLVGDWVGRASWASGPNPPEHAGGVVEKPLEAEAHLGALRPARPVGELRALVGHHAAIALVVRHVAAKIRSKEEELETACRWPEVVARRRTRAKVPNPECRN